MGTPDSFYLLESIVCPNCITSAEEVEIEPEEKPSKIPGLNIVLINAHAGISHLQTYDLENMLNNFYFPGLVEYNLSYGLVIPEPGENNVNDFCSGCDTLFEGELTLEEVSGTGKVAATQVVLRARIKESVLPYEERICRHPLYEITVSQELDGNDDGRMTTITIVPRLEACIKSHIEKQRGFMDDIQAIEQIYNVLLGRVSAISDKYREYAARIDKKRQDEINPGLNAIKENPYDDNPWLYLDAVQKLRERTWGVKHDFTHLCLSLAYLLHETNPKETITYVRQPPYKDVQESFERGLDYLKRFKEGIEDRRAGILFPGLKELFDMGIYDYSELQPKR